MDIIYFEKINRNKKLLKYALFNNIKFIQSGNYYINHKYGKLHRYIYEYYNKHIPKGYVIHHIDFNPNNNDISNLQLLTRVKHTSLHHKDTIRKPHSKETIKKISNTLSGRKLSEETKINMSNSKKGNKSYRWIEPTEEMIQDVENNMKRKDFLIKYNVSRRIFEKVKNYIQKGIYKKI